MGGGALGIKPTLKRLGVQDGREGGRRSETAAKGSRGMHLVKANEMRDDALVQAGQGLWD